MNFFPASILTEAAASDLLLLTLHHGRLKLRQKSLTVSPSFAIWCGCIESVNSALQKSKQIDLQASLPQILRKYIDAHGTQLTLI